jgi:hypothetical protein
MLSAFVQKLKFLDGLVSQRIAKDLIPYDLIAASGIVTKQLPLFIKIIFYLLILLLPFLFWKLLQPLNKKINIVLVILLFLIGVFAFGIFLGFLQILYS